MRDKKIHVIAKGLIQLVQEDLPLLRENTHQWSSLVQQQLTSKYAP
jgi:hypothetical protein